MRSPAPLRDHAGLQRLRFLCVYMILNPVPAPSTAASGWARANPAATARPAVAAARARPPAPAVRSASVLKAARCRLIRRIPKRGFNNARHTTRYLPVNLEALNRFDDGARVDEAALRERGPGQRPRRRRQDPRRRRTDAQAHGQRARLQRLGQGQDRSQRRTCERLPKIDRPQAEGEPAHALEATLDSASARILIPPCLLPSSTPSANCFKIPELKSRILFTLLVLAICRLVAVVRIPGSGWRGAGGVLSSSKAEQRRGRRCWACTACSPAARWSIARSGRWASCPTSAPPSSSSC